MFVFTLLDSDFLYGTVYFTGSPFGSLKVETDLGTWKTKMSETYDSNVKLTLMKTSSQGSTGRELGMCAFNGGGLEFVLMKPEHPSNLGHKRANMPETG